MKMDTVFTYDELEKKLIDNPYPFYDFLLSHKGPVFAIDKKGSNHKILLLSRYNEVSKLLSLNKEISADPDYLQKNNHKNFWSLSLLNTDGEKHILMRKILSNYFTKDRLNSISDFLENYIPQLMNSLKTINEVDLIEHVAEAVPLSVLGYMIGVSRKNELRHLRDWALGLNPLMDTFISKNNFTELAASNEAINSLEKYAKELISQRKNNPENNLINYIVSACLDKNITYEIMLANIIFILIASLETTINMIGNGIFLLSSHPKELEKLISNPDLAFSATEEILRFESPKQRASYRISKESIEIEGLEIKANTQVIVFLGAANRDPTQFKNPSEFNISRENINHLAFGNGIHNCLGKTLARLEVNLLFPEIAKLLLELELKDKNSIWRKNTFFRSPEKLLFNRNVF